MAAPGPDDQSCTQSPGVEFLFEHTTDCIVEGSIQDGDPIVHRVNDAFESVFGYTTSELRGENLNDFITPEGKQDEVEAVDQAIRDGDIGPREVTRLTVDGPRDFLLRATGGEGERSYAIYTDVTAQKERERELRRFERAVEATGHVVFITDPDGTIEYVNPAFEEITGYSADEAVGETPRILNSGEMSEEYFENLWTTILAGETWSESLINRRKSGELYHASQTIAPIVADGEVTAFVAIQTDITERKEAEQELRERESKYRSLFEDTRDALVLLDSDSFIDCNEQTLELFGIESVEAFVEYSPWELSPATQPDGTDSKTAAREHIKTAFDSGEAYFEWTYQRGDGTTFPAEVKLSRFEHDDEAVLHALVRDVTERKEAERARKQARERLRQVIDLIPDPIFVKNRDDEIVLSNEANAKLLGAVTPGEVANKPEPEFFPESDYYETLRQRDIDVIESGESTTFEEDLTPLVDEKLIFKTTRIPFEMASTAEDAVLGYARDVTEIKEYEQELEETNEKLDQFAGVVSHDLRNPLNVIKGRARLLRQEAPDEHVKPIERNVERMETIIDDLLTLSRAGESVDDLEPVPLTTVVADSWAAVSSDDIELEVDIPDDVDVEADSDRLRHVFENLFRNASEHNDPPVTIRVGTLSGETGLVSGFFIADNGAGIPASDREKVFEYGYTTNTDGTGFGLSIVEEIVEAHGWTISVTESDAGGVRFEVHMTGQS